MESGRGEDGEGRHRGSEFERAVDHFEELDDPTVAHERVERPERPPAPPRAKSRQMRGETIRRVLVAIPWIAFAIAITVAGGIPFSLAMIGIGLLCTREFLTMSAPMRPIGIAAYLTVTALVVAAHFGTAFNVLLVLAASFLALFAFGANRKHRDGITVSMGVTLLGILWIGIPLVHAVLLARPARPRRRAADRRPRRDLRQRHRRLRDRPDVRLAPDRPQPLAEQDDRGARSAAS